MLGICKFSPGKDVVLRDFGGWSWKIAGLVSDEAPWQTSWLDELQHKNYKPAWSAIASQHSSNLFSYWNSMEKPKSRFFGRLFAELESTYAQASKRFAAEPGESYDLSFHPARDRSIMYSIHCWTIDPSAGDCFTVNILLFEICCHSANSIPVSEIPCINAFDLQDHDHEAHMQQACNNTSFSEFFSLDLGREQDKTFVRPS